MADVEKNAQLVQASGNCWKTSKVQENKLPVVHFCRVEWLGIYSSYRVERIRSKGRKCSWNCKLLFLHVGRWTTALWKRPRQTGTRRLSGYTGTTRASGTGLGLESELQQRPELHKQKHPHTQCKEERSLIIINEVISFIHLQVHTTNKLWQRIRKKLILRTANNLPASIFVNT